MDTNGVVEVVGIFLYILYTLKCDCDFKPCFLWKRDCDLNDDCVLAMYCV